MIYVQWLRSKRKLFAALMDPERKVPIDVILEDWFRQNIFEFGVSHLQDRYYLQELRGECVLAAADMAAMARESCITQLVDGILRQGLFTTESYDDYFGRTTNYRILIAGVADMVGPLERKAG